MSQPNKSKIRTFFLSLTLCVSNAGFVAAFDKYGGEPVFVFTPICQAIESIQPFDNDITVCVDSVTYKPQRDMYPAPVDWIVPDQSFIVAADQSESQSPTFAPPAADLPQTPDPEPEPPTNVPGPELPPSIQPKPAQPGLPPPPMPQPAAPQLAPAPPPMPQPAEPPPLSDRPDLNPANPGAPQEPPQSKPSL